MTLFSFVGNCGRMSAAGYGSLGTSRILVTQALVTLVLSAGFAVGGFAWFYSALAGGLACILPNAYALWRVFGARRTRNRPPMGTVAVMLRAEFAKFALTAAVFVLIFWLLPAVAPIPMFSVFVVAMFAGYIEAGLRA